MQRFYPAVLERGPKQSYGVWFPDFAGAVAAGVSQEEAIARAHDALARGVESLAERDRPLPEPTPFEHIAIPKDCEFVAFVAVAVEPPDPSERVNIYLSRSLLARADRRAAELGMSRSSFFGYTITMALSMPALPVSHKSSEIPRGRAFGSPNPASRRPAAAARPDARFRVAFTESGMTMAGRFA